MRKRATWLSVGGGVAGVIILVAIAVSLIAARSEPITSATIVRTRAPESFPQWHPSRRIPSMMRQKLNGSMMRCARSLRRQVMESSVVQSILGRVIN